MDAILSFIRTDNFLLILAGLICLLFILYVINITKLRKIRKEYKKFMEKVGNGTNLEEILGKQIDKMNKVIAKNEELQDFCVRLDTDMKNCIQKVGIYRYNAYKDTGNDLSFTVALLNEKNDGVVFNGIYSREMSNIYAKPVKNGKSTYTITEEEEKAIKIWKPMPRFTRSK